jgi:ABC-type proline/glycine betaine transport system permease subunit
MEVLPTFINLTDAAIHMVRQPTAEVSDANGARSRQ